MKNKIIKNNKGPARTCFRKGFTLLEALVAISILMVAVVAPITIAQKGLSSAVYTKNQMIASYLAQDALEHVKNRRDENALNPLPNGNRLFWLSGLENCLIVNGAGDGCQIDTVKNGGIGVVYQYIGTKLNVDSDDGFYIYDTGDETNFTRQITITETSSGEMEGLEAEVNVIVKWGEEDEKVDVTTWIYNY